MEDTVEWADVSLELLRLEGVECPLGISISIFIEWCIESSGWLFWRFEVEGYNVFTNSNSLIGATIQDGGKRERSDWIQVVSFIQT